MRQNSSVFCPSAIVCRREENQSDRHQEHVCLSKGTQPYRVLLSLTMKTISPSYLLDAGTVLFVRLYGNTTWVMCWSRTVVLLSRPRMRHSLLSFIRRAPTCVASRLVVQQSRRLLQYQRLLSHTEMQCQLVCATKSMPLSPVAEAYAVRSAWGLFGWTVATQHR